jgi:hypothetical protein
VFDPLVEPERVTSADSVTVHEMVSLPVCTSLIETVSVPAPTADTK